MNIVYSSSDAYSELAAVSIVSVMENTRDADEINFYVIDKGISEKHKQDMLSMTNSYGRQLVFLENLDVEKIVDTNVCVGRWHISTFSRLFVLHVLPEDMKKIIYLDCDMIIRHSLTPLWEMDMDGTWCMSADDCRGKKYRENIGIPEDSIYTNNGLMVIDLEAWRQNNVEKLFIDFIRKYNGDVTYVDQGVLNGVFQPLGKVKLLPISYNAQRVCYDLGYDGLEACRAPVWPYTREEFEQGLRDPVVVHFTTCFMTETRPWYKKDDHPFRDDFLKYRSLTAWRDEPLWDDPTKTGKRMMRTVCRILPRPVTFACIRVAHVWLYPMVRNIKMSAAKKRRKTDSE